MLGLFHAGSQASSAVSAAAAARVNKPRKNVAGAPSATGSDPASASSKLAVTAPTVAASDVLVPANGAAPTRSVHAFNAPDAEEVLKLRRLLVKVIAAKDLPESVGARRSCSCEVQLISDVGMHLGSDALHERTGPPNHFTTVKDTSPVWNAEFVAEVPATLQTARAALRFTVRDDAASPPQTLGEAIVHGDELQALCMREEEKTLSLSQSALPSASAVAQSIASGQGLRNESKVES